MGVWRHGFRKEVRGGRPRLVIDFRYRDNEGKSQRFRRDAAVQTATAARAEAARLMALAARTGSPFEAPGPPTFEIFVEEQYRTLFMPRLRPGTRIRYDGIFRQGVAEHFGPLRLDQLGPQEVRRYAAGLLERGVSPRGHVDLVAGVLRAAVECGHLAEMPKLPRYKPNEKLPDAPTVEEVTNMLECAEGWLRVAVALAVYAGLRQGEVRGLKVGDIDFASGLLYVRRAFSEDELVATPKGKRDRVVPLAWELRQIIAPAVKDRLPGAFVVVDKGNVPRRQQVLHQLKRLQTAYGLRERSFHSLRHFFCSRLLQTGASVEAVRVLAGHRELKTTERYLHATDAELVRAVGRLGNRGQ